MRASIRVLILAVCVAFAITACGGSSSPPDTDLDWDLGNWDEQEWQ